MEATPVHETEIVSFIDSLAPRLEHLRAVFRSSPESSRAAVAHLRTSIRETQSESSETAWGELLESDDVLADMAAQAVVFGLLADQQFGGRSVCGAVRGLACVADTADWLRGLDVDQLLQTTSRGGQAVHPLIHLHEQLLRSADAGLRRRRGVFYTPAPIVHWILRAVAACVADCSPREAGVRWIDPACGSGAFLYGVIEQGLQQVGRPASDALIGFEVLPATQVVALTLLSQAASANQRRPLQIECVNPLTAGEALAAQVLGDGDQLPVILGNPPYANFGRQNQGTWIRRLLRDYKTGLHERKLNLDDDFIKFLRWGQYWVERAGRGVLAMVTNRTYLDGLTHRAMRGSLAGAFDEIYLLDLGGDVDARRNVRPRTEDENVFGIRRGVAIGVFVKTGPGRATARVRYHRLRGTRAEKFTALDRLDLHATPWQAVTVASPQNDFVPRPRRSNQYRTWPRIIDVFPDYVSGVQTKNDALLTDLQREALAERMRALLGGDAAASGGGVDQRSSVERARNKFSDRLAGLTFEESRLREYLVAPFDRRWIYYEPRLVGRARFRTMRHMLRPNVALVFMRQSTCEGPYDHFLATDTLASDRVFYSTHGAPFLAPLWLWEDGGDGSEPQRRANLNPDFAREFAERLGANYCARGGSRETSDAFAKDGTLKRSATADAIRPEDIFHCLYAMFFCSDYRRRYHDELRVDFPRIPPLEEPKRFGKLCMLGRRLVDLHLRRSGPLPAADASARPACLDDLPEAHRQWRLGGYAVLPRWIHKRCKHEQTDLDRNALNCLVDTIAQTIHVVREIDAV